MISSNTNQRIKNLINVKKSAKERREQGVFFVEGPRMFFEAPPSRIKEAYITEAFLDKYSDRLEGLKYELISESVCEHVCDTKTPQGVAALIKKDEKDVLNLIGSSSYPSFIILESVQDPGNVGTILRTAEAAGITAIIMNRETADPYSPKVIRSTMGAVYRQPFKVVDDLAPVLNTLKEKGIKLYATHLKGTNIYTNDFTEPCAFMIGNEGNGLSRELSQLSDKKLLIPMKGKVESLNAAMAAGIVMYEMFRQRNLLKCQLLDN